VKIYAVYGEEDCLQLLKAGILPERILSSSVEEPAKPRPRARKTKRRVYYSENEVWIYNKL